MVGADDVDVTKAMRTAGLPMLATVVAIDALARIVARWRRAVATNAINVVDQ
jgi:hypothetical protein